MRIVADGDLGIVLVFGNVEDLAKTIKNLQTLQQWKAEEKSPYPAAYNVASVDVPEKQLVPYVAEAKKVVAGGGGV